MVLAFQLLFLIFNLLQVLGMSAPDEEDANFCPLHPLCESQPSLAFKDSMSNSISLFDCISSHLISSHLISSHLISSHLISSHPSSHLIPHLISSHSPHSHSSYLSTL
jgi:hypothetical protein